MNWKEFLPRGPRLVTRRPVVVQLIPSAEEYGVFLHKENEKFTEFGHIRNEISCATDEECGPNGFSSKPISLTIYSPRVLKLTVVDLPGIIRVTVGNTNDEAIRIVREMVLDYIKNENCIILAVTPTGQDIANSDALELSRIVDPDGIRTIGVLTKLDLMEEGTDARDILDNTHLPLKRGWVGVINRSCKDIIDGKDMQYILKTEKDFFQNSELYSHMAHRLGTPYLQRLLQKTLRAHIKQCLPEVRKEIAQKLCKFQKELKELDVIGSGSSAKQVYMVRLIQKFCDEIYVKIMGYSEMVLPNVVTHGALINFKMYTEVQRMLSQALLLNEEEILTQIVNINGMRNSVSIPSLVVNSVCHGLIERFKDPLDSSVICIKHILVDAVQDTASVLNSYPSLKHELLYHINLWIEKESENTMDRLKSHVDAEAFFINTGHPDFDSTTCDPVAPPAGPVKIWADSAVKKEQNQDELITFKKMLQMNEQMQKQVHYVTALVIKYLEIVQKQITDIAIKYIAYFLVKKVLDCIRYNLVTIILDSSNISSITEDCEDDIKRKEELEATCNILQEALNAIKAF